MTKQIILNLLAKEEELDAAGVAQRVRSTPEAAGMMLLRLWRQGLIQREIDPGDGVLFYTVTQKGHARLRYWHDTQSSRRRSDHAQENTGSNTHIDQSDIEIRSMP